MADQPPDMSPADEAMFLSLLADAEPRWAKDGLGIRGNEKQVISQTVRSEWPEATVKLVKGDTPPLTQPVEFAPPVVPTAVASERTPFQVYKSRDNSEPPYPILKVYPGRIGGIQPKLAGEFLTKEDDEDGDHPWYYVAGEDTALFIKVRIDKDNPPANAFRSIVIQDGTIIVDKNDPAAVSDIDAEMDPPDLPEWKVFWDDETHVKGRFYIRIADIKGSIDEEAEDSGVRIGKITQWLFTNYRTFSIAGEDVIPLT